MTYGEVFMKWLQRILIALLIIAIVGMVITSVAKARQVSKQTEAYCRYLDAKYGWTWED